VRAGLAGVAACTVALALAAGAQGADDPPTPIEATVRQLALELSTACPIADPGDRKALDACRQGLFHDSLLRRSLDTILLWGRPHPQPGASLKDTALTRFGPEVWTGLYAPLFMFDGDWRIDYDDNQKLYRATLGALFRNALEPGQYPYPFWHNARKWNDYQTANAIVLWIAPTGTILAGQFIDDGQRQPRLTSLPVARPPFDGQWMWTDRQGETQPATATSPGPCAKATAAAATRRTMPAIPSAWCCFRRPLTPPRRSSG
jgi:hypothetical protein